MDTVQGFIELFQGNLGALGTEEGGALRLNPKGQPALARFIKAHLTGEHEPIGVYPMRLMTVDSDAQPMFDGWVVRWGCIDFDEGEQESWVHAKNVHLALQTFGVCGWIERSRSKGYHVWVFLQEWTAAWLVRQALLAACQIVEAPTREINPKQTELQPGQLGNYVRLPYPDWLGLRAATHGNKRVVLNPHQDGRYALTLERFVAVALEARTDVAALEKLAGYYKPPVRPLRTRDWGPALEGEAVDRLLGKARIIWENGPLEGGDRSDTLYKLAMYLKEDARHTRDEAYDLLADADERWGKFSSRPDCEARLNDMLDKAGF